MLTTNTLPDQTMHHFPGAVRPGRDVAVYCKDGVQYVERSAKKGASFLCIQDADADQAVHASFRGQCFLTVPGLELKSGFMRMAMHRSSRKRMTFFWRVKLGNRRARRGSRP
jgi:hypothetical protein